MRKVAKGERERNKMKFSVQREERAREQKGLSMNVRSRETASDLNQRESSGPLKGEWRP